MITVASIQFNASQSFTSPRPSTLGSEESKKIYSGVADPIRNSVSLPTADFKPKWSNAIPDAQAIFNALAEAKMYTAQIAMHIDKAWRDKLFLQLDNLHDPDEWCSGDIPVEIESFRTFLRVILQLCPERRPGLGLSNAGNLIASWATDGQNLIIEFLTNGRVRWTASIKNGSDKARYAGDIPPSQIKADFEKLNAREIWFNAQPAKS